ncbi:MAG TPA: glycosidase [Planctomycetaceae bacterium]|nr:glycosidase [Planctomycetaceae bacterium]
MSEQAVRGRRRPLDVCRLPIRFEHDQRRVITRLFVPGGAGRVRNVIQRVRQLSEDQVRHTLAAVLANFVDRHRDIEAVFDEHYEAVAGHVGPLDDMSRDRRRLIGSYFTMEYSIEAAALFNPSIVEHPNQTRLPSDAVRFLMSLRATGEGHISSVVFRSGVIHADQTICFDPPSRYAQVGRIRPDKRYQKPLFRRKLLDIGLTARTVDHVMDRLPESFTFGQLEEAMSEAQEDGAETLRREDVGQSILWLARSNYQLELPRDAHASEIVLFPQSESESGGIEDLRMVRFVDDDGSVTYYGTYTAYDGYHILPQLMETKDLVHISVHTLNGAVAQNKGMALFPRRIGGHYVMCSRIDGENLYIMYSDMLHFWESAELLQAPRHPWELIQVGNCGSPLETPEGWLLLTHGVGPMRRYCIGAMLLQLDDPTKVIGSLDEPLIVPTEDEREGYVPNVVYSCGALIHGNYLYIPYGMSDWAAGMAIVRLDELLDRLLG